MEKSPQSAPAAPPWYEDGLRFTCTGCGNCCTGAPGYVWLTDAEIESLAARTCEGDVPRFVAIYARQVNGGMSLKELPGGDCIFFDRVTRRCGVYEDRPRQCRTWPFWDSNVHSPKAWEETCRECPGAGQGKLYSLEEVHERCAEIRI